MLHFTFNLKILFFHEVVSWIIFLWEQSFAHPDFRCLKIKTERANQKTNGSPKPPYATAAKSRNLWLCQCDFIAGWKMSKVRMTNQSSEEKWLLDERCHLSWLPFHCTRPSPLFHVNAIWPLVFNYLNCTMASSWKLYFLSKSFRKY